MKCPFCGHSEDRVVASRVGRDGEFIRRRRACLACNRRYTTYEYIEDVLPRVVKRDGRREPFDRHKLLQGVRIACAKRPIAMADIDRVVDQIEEHLFSLGKAEVQSEVIGAMVLEKLRELDPLAYIRFAIVYMEMEDVGALQRELERMMKERK